MLWFLCVIAIFCHGVVCSDNFEVQAKPSIVLVDYDPTWQLWFEAEAEPIKSALGENCVAVHHIGSTAIPGLSAKPVIDILAVVKSFLDVKPVELEQLGFGFKGEVIKSGRYFSRQDPRVHLHVFEEGNPLIVRYLNFRDWLREHEEDRLAYAVLKRELASRHTDGMEYAKDKTAFVEQIIAKEENQKRAQLTIENVGREFKRMSIPTGQ